MAVLEKRDIFLGILVGTLVGLPVSAVIAGTISWYALAKHQRELVRDLDAGMAVVVVEPLAAGEPVRASKLAQRAVLNLNISSNTVLAKEAAGLAGKAPSISFQPGDLLLRSAFGLPPREEAPAPAPAAGAEPPEPPRPGPPTPPPPSRSPPAP